MCTFLKKKHAYSDRFTDVITTIVMMENELYLGFIRTVGIDVNGDYTYELFFTEKPDSFWGEDFGEVPAAICSELVPYEDTYSKVIEFRTSVKLVTALESTQFSIQDAIDHCTCLAYEDLSEKDYPEYRLVLQFGETYSETVKKLSNKGISISDVDNLF